jgi:hypothetical protein
MKINPLLKSKEKCGRKVSTSAVTVDPMMLSRQIIAWLKPEVESMPSKT